MNGNKLQVYHVIYDLSAAGAQTVVMNYLRKMKDDEDYTVGVIVLGKYQGKKYEEELVTGHYDVRYCNFTPTNRGGLIRPLLNWTKCQIALYKTIKKARPDIIHSHLANILPYLCFPAFFLRIKVKIHTLHSDPYAVPKMYQFWTKLAVKVFGFYPICVTEDQAKKVEKKYGFHRYSIVHNGLDINKYKSHRNDSVTIRRQLGIPLDAFVIGYVGSLYSTKNVGFLIDVFCAYLECNPNAFLLVVGDGVEKEGLIDKCIKIGIKNRVLFTGNRDDVIDMYSIMNLFMLTSRHESSSIVTVEAQLCGLPCLVSDAVPNDVVISSGTVRLGLSEPLDKWVSTIRNMRFDRSSCSNEFLFSVEKSIEDTKEIYRQCQ